MTAVFDIEELQNCPTELKDAGKVSVCNGCPGKELCLSQGSVPDPDASLLQLRLKAVKHKIIILSGKGGVGKSTVSAAVSQILASRGYSVGLLDIDICGPSAPMLMNVTGQPIIDSQWGWKPLVSPFGKVKILSVGSLLASDMQAIVWRGPRKTALIRRMIKDTLWGRLDYLIVDTPPGTSDEHLTIVKLLASTQPDGAVIITSPQGLSAGVVSKEIRFCQKLNVPIIGLVENMSGFSCPCCKAITSVFPGNAGKVLSDKYDVPLLGCIPLDSNFPVYQEGNHDLVKEYGNTALMSAIGNVVDSIEKSVIK